MGRRSTFTQELADEICNRIAEGEPLRQICRDEHMPGWVAVYRWLDEHPEFRERFACARKLGFDAIAEEALEISNTPVEGKRIKRSEDGHEETIEDMLGHRKLQIETRLKLLAKWDPSRYGEKLALGGASDLPPIQTNTTLDPSEAYKRMLEAGK